MKINELSAPVDPKQQLTEDVRADSISSTLLGIDPNSALHAQMTDELERLKQHDPRLYHKIVTLN